MKIPELTPEHQAARAVYKARMLRTELGAIAEHLPADDLEVLLELARKFRAFDLGTVGFDADLPASVTTFGVVWTRCPGCEQVNHPAGERRWVDDAGIHADGATLRRWLQGAPAE